MFEDGSYYKGKYQNGHACDQSGEYHSEKMTFRGGFSNDCFEGAGIEEGPGYMFEGDFSEGHRVKGELKWKDKDGFDCIYRGTFNQFN